MHTAPATRNRIDLQHNNLASPKCFGKHLSRHVIALWVAGARANHGTIGDTRTREMIWISLQY